MYLPHPSYRDSVKVLKTETLGQMRISAQRIFVKNREDPDPLDPAVSFWKGYDSSLSMYQLFCIQEFIDRGGPNDMLPLISVVPRREGAPPSLGDPKFHLSQKSILVSTDPAYKRAFGSIEYLWYEYWPHMERGGTDEENKLREGTASFTF